MKRRHIILLVTLLALAVGCSVEEPRGNRGGTQEPGSKEVEIDISTSAADAVTRAPLDGAIQDEGAASEKAIATLDMLVFDQNDNYLYRREAYRVSTTGNKYRVLLQESADPLNVYLFANVRTILQQWETTATPGETWATIRAQLIDNQPERLVGQGAPVPLPMYGEKLRQTIDTERAPSRWGSVLMRRSVASADVFVEQTTDIIANFRLTGLLAWYAPDMGYLAAIPDQVNTTPIQQYLSPTAMTTSLNGALNGQMYAGSVSEYLAAAKNYEGVAYQIYFYDNHATNTDMTDGDTRRPTRIIVAGEFRNASTGAWANAYYPIDIVNDLGVYRPAIRNWKYEFNVTKVTGPGYQTPEEAAQGKPIDLNVEIIDWDKDDVAVGVRGQYYVSMRTKNAILFRNADDYDELPLTYEMFDGGPDEFEYDFQTITPENPQIEDVDADGEVTAIRNNYFKVEFTQDGDATGGTGSFKVTALQDMTDADGPRRGDFLVVKFRELSFVITITQYNSSEEDWGDGGEVPVNL